jgi:hypothetical protein
MLFFIISKIEAAIELSSQDMLESGQFYQRASSASDDDFSMDTEALQERAPGDVLGQILDRDAGLHAPDVRLGKNKLAEGNVA